MNAYAKMQDLTGFNNPCDAIVPDVNVNNKDKMDIINESSINSMLTDFLEQNNIVASIFEKMCNTNYEYYEILDTHERFYPMDIDLVFRLWHKLFTLTKISNAMRHTSDIDDLFFLSENKTLIGVDLVFASHAHPDINAIFDRMKKTIDVCIPQLPMLA